MARCSRGLLGDVVVDPVGLGDLVADRVERVQRGQRVLEDHRDVAGRGSLRICSSDSAEHLGAVDPDRAATPGALGVVQAQDRQLDDRLAGAGLAHDAEGLAPLDGEASGRRRP